MEGLVVLLVMRDGLTYVKMQANEGEELTTKGIVYICNNGCERDGIE